MQASASLCVFPVFTIKSKEFPRSFYFTFTLSSSWLRTELRFFFLALTQML